MLSIKFIFFSIKCYSLSFKSERERTDCRTEREGDTIVVIKHSSRHSGVEEHRASCMAESRNNLSSLVHELRERIAASSSTPNSGGGGGGGGSGGEGDDALEIRFRAVLPNLLHAYVVLSPSGGPSSLKPRSSVVPEF